MRFCMTLSHASIAWVVFLKCNDESDSFCHKHLHAQRYKSKNKGNEMAADFVDGNAFNFEQGQRARKLFAAVVLAALDDAIADDKKYGNGPEQIARWARSRDGREVLSCAGIDPNERVVSGLMAFVGNGVRTSVALSREESERRNQAEAA